VFLEPFSNNEKLFGPFLFKEELPDLSDPAICFKGKVYQKIKRKERFLNTGIGSGPPEGQGNS
jgi:hypothetical protein